MDNNNNNNLIKLIYYLISPNLIAQMPFTKQAWVMKGNKTQLNCKQQGAL
jgi:hypothetical protein